MTNLSIYDISLLERSAYNMIDDIKMLLSSNETVNNNLGVDFNILGELVISEYDYGQFIPVIKYTIMNDVNIIASDVFKITDTCAKSPPL